MILSRAEALISIFRQKRAGTGGFLTFCYIFRHGSRQNISGKQHAGCKEKHAHIIACQIEQMDSYISRLIKV